MRLEEMKKKIQLVDNRQAISAVIGVTLMVAVATAMAAVSYAYMTGMIGGENLEAAPIIDFSADNIHNSLLITYSEVEVDLEEFRIVGTDGVNIQVFQDETGPLTGDASVGGKIFINDVATTVSGTIIVTVTHMPSDTMLHEFTFDDVI